jgi:hypothetical protein
MLVWVDDINTAFHADCREEYEAFWNKFGSTFQFKELGPVTDYLGMQVS